jgi:hypothetical protein
VNKFVQPRPYANPEAAAPKLLEIAHAFQPAQEGRIYIEAINGPMLFEYKAHARGNTRPALTWLSSADGWICTRAVRLYALRRSAETCLHKSAHGNLSRLG